MTKDFSELAAELFPPARKQRSFDLADPELALFSRPKTCPRCGRTFFGCGRVRFCGKRCQLDDRNATRRERRAACEYDLITCANPDCGMGFRPIRSTARFCSDACRQALHRKRSSAKVADSRNARGK